MRWTEFATQEARQTLALWESRVGPLTPPIAVEDLADLLYLLAIDVTYDLPRNLAGRFYAEQRIIEVRRSDLPQRQRFTIAHEIGHYRLHVIAESAQISNYACSEAAIASGDGDERSPRRLRATPLPGFTAPSAPSASTTSDYDRRRREIEANAFAAALLMPAAMVERAVEHYGKDISALAELFAVSHQAMRYRLEKLLLLPRPGPQTSFLTDL